MKNLPSFDDEKAGLADACLKLRGFTLARPGASRRSGVRAVALVHALRDRMTDLFSQGPHALQLTSFLVSVRGQLLAAEARLSLLSNLATGKKSSRH